MSLTLDIFHFVYIELEEQLNSHHTKKQQNLSIIAIDHN